MKISDIVMPTPENIAEIKHSYNRVLKRQNEASNFLDNPGISQLEKDKHLIQFKVEVIDPLGSYLKVLKDWNVEIDDSEILGGMKIE